MLCVVRVLCVLCVVCVMCVLGVKCVLCVDSRTVPETDCCPNMLSELISKKSGLLSEKDCCPKTYHVSLLLFTEYDCIGIMYSMAKGGHVTGYESRDLISKLDASYHAAEGRYLAA